MKQVPEYLIIGNGRVSRHFQHYFSLLQLPFTQWNRNEHFEKLHHQLINASHILLLISDAAIENFIIHHLKTAPQTVWVHFSGSLISHYAHGAHPLMTFNETLYLLDEYLKIPFILDDDAPSFQAILPGLPNPYQRLPKSLKAKYHALCVLSGNFSCLLWQKLFDSFQREFNLPESFAHPYLLRQTQNLILDQKKALTGPLVRKDQGTIEKNLAALSSDPFKEIYEAFVSCYQKKEEIDR